MANKQQFIQISTTVAKKNDAEKMAKILNKKYERRTVKI